MASTILYGSVSIILMYGLIPDTRPGRIHSLTAIRLEPGILKQPLHEPPRVDRSPDEDKSEDKGTPPKPLPDTRVKASTPVKPVKHSTESPAPGPEPLSAQGYPLEPKNFFTQYTDLAAIGQKLLWEVPNLNLAILDDGTGAWWRGVQKLGRDLAFSCGAISSGKVLALSSVTHVFTYTNFDTAGFYAMKVNHADNDAGIGDVVHEASQLLHCNVAGIQALVLYTRQDLMTMAGKVALEAQHRRVAVSSLSGATLIYLESPKLDLQVVDLFASPQP